MANITPADRRIESGRDTRACARGDQSDPLARRHADHLAKRGTERRSDLDDRTFPSDRRTATDRNGRRQGFNQRHYGSDDAALVVDGVHHFWDPMALGLGGKIGHQEGHADGAHHRNQDYQCAPRRGRSKDVCVVVDDRATGKEQVVYEADQISEDHGPEAGDDTKTEGKQGELHQRHLAALLALHHACRRRFCRHSAPSRRERRTNLSTF
jgi:hypothetical protein